MRFQTVLALLALSTAAFADTCGIAWNNTAPNVAAGWTAYPLVENLKFPRHLLFDKNGNLLIVDRGTGIVALKLNTLNGCVVVEDRKVLLMSSELNHGIAISQDGKRIFASSATSVFSWEYDPEVIAITSERSTVVTGMHSSGLLTRTLLVPESDPDRLIVQMGAKGNMDLSCTEPSGCNIKTFDISELPEEPYDYVEDGELLAWGLRNAVGIAEHSDGGIWSVENAPDDVSHHF